MIVVGVHWTIDVGGSFQSCAFVLYGTSRVVLFYPVVCRIEVDSISCFISKTPSNDGRVVLVDTNVVLVTFQVCFFETGLMCEGFFSVAHAMAFEVGFCHDIDTVLVAKVIPAGIVGIVTGSYRVDVMLFHYFDIFNHALNRNNVASIRVHFMSVGSFYKYGFPVDEELSVLDFCFTEPDALSEGFYDFLAILQVHTQAIKIGSFGRPLLGRLNGGGQVTFAFAGDGFRMLVNGLSFGICQSLCQCLVFAFCAVSKDTQYSVLIVVVKFRSDENI